MSDPVDNATPSVETVFGPLGGAIVRIVLLRGESSVGDVVEVLETTRGRRPAYTTVMTVMSRLHENGVLRRSKVGRGYRYRASADEARLVARMSGRAVDELIRRYGTAALRQFAERVNELEPELRDRLIHLASGK